VLAIAVMVLVLGSSAVGALEGEPVSKGLFTAASARATVDRAGDVGVVRSRYVRPNLELLLDADGTPRDLAGMGALTLNLFDDTELVAVLDRVEPNYGGGYTWVGQVQDDPLSMATLVVTDGLMAGTVATAQSSFGISYAGDGGHVVQEIDPSAFPPEAGPIPVDEPEGEAADVVPMAQADDGTAIDVLVVYTPSARWAVGGTTAMLNLINLAVAETNQSYANSGIIQRLNLVHAAEVPYSETTFSAALYDLTGTSDGNMDNVHALRNAYFADEVVLIINDTQYCGLAWLMQNVSTSFQDHAFAVVHWGCATGYYSFGHELGHNMGAQHDLFAVQKYNQAPGAYWYSYGYVNSSPAWRTVMAYGDACGGCTRIPWWSNPGVFYGGDPTGTATANNHLTLNNTAWTVANFRVCPEPNAPTNLSATAVPPWQINLTWTDTSGNEVGFRIERSSGGSWSTLAAVGANTTSYADTSATPSTTYSYRVIAYNACGDSAPSNTDSATLPVIIGPLVYNGYLIDDDNSGGTSGNGNGYLNCGETVDLTVLLYNEGNTAVEGINSTLGNPGGTGAGDVSWTGNTTSPYPNIVGGVGAGNLSAFDFSIEALAEHGHWIDYDLAVTADNWSGGPISFSLPILCSATADYRHYLPLISR
jgi:hypothetical protein